MTAKLLFFSVGNGDMTLVQTDHGRNLLIDMNIRNDPNVPNVASELRGRLTRDDAGRLFLDALLISHPDQDHCRGLEKHFHLGPPDQWSKYTDKIFVREIWSSPMVFRRASKNHELCDDAKAFNSEARRRVKVYRESRKRLEDGERILILGEDEDGKTDDLNDILVRVGEEILRINGSCDSSIQTKLLAPLPAYDQNDDSTLSKNNSSTILRISLSGGGIRDKCRYLTGGDAGVVIWERLWSHYFFRTDWLSYDVLLSPHHCSWHSLSHDSWSEKGSSAKVSEDALNALSQARSNAIIVASSNPILDDDNDPPCIGAKREYEKIARYVSGSFECVSEFSSKNNSNLMEFEIGSTGWRLISGLLAVPVITSPAAIGQQHLPHG